MFKPYPSPPKYKIKDPVITKPYEVNCNGEITKFKSKTGYIMDVITLSNGRLYKIATDEGIIGCPESFIEKAYEQ